jgi:hypothetical protein
MKVPDSHANEVEKQGLAKSDPVSGTSRAKYPTRGWCAGLCVDLKGQTMGNLWRTIALTLHGQQNKGA